MQARAKNFRPYIPVSVRANHHSPWQRLRHAKRIVWLDKMQTTVEELRAQA
jgi:hypothetical protein